MMNAQEYITTTFLMNATAKMENDVIYALKNLGYKDRLLDKEYFSKALNDGSTSLEFINLVHTLTAELETLHNLDETVFIMSDKKSFCLLGLGCFLEKLGCPYKELITGIQTRAKRLLLLEFLISELMVAKIVHYNNSAKSKRNLGAEIVMQESPTAKDLKDILIALKLNKPPSNITSKVFFPKLEARFKQFIVNEGNQLVGKPLYSKPLTENDWKNLEVTFKDMFEEYRCRREMLIIRFDSTVQNCQKADDFESKRMQMNAEPEVKLSDFLAARTSLLEAENMSWPIDDDGVDDQNSYVGPLSQRLDGNNRHGVRLGNIQADSARPNLQSAMYVSRIQTYEILSDQHNQGKTIHYNAIQTKIPSNSLLRQIVHPGPLERTGNDVNMAEGMRAGTVHEGTVFGESQSRPTKNPAKGALKRQRRRLRRQLLAQARSFAADQNTNSKRKIEEDGLVAQASSPTSFTTIRPPSPKKRRTEGTKTPSTGITMAIVAEGRNGRQDLQEEHMIHIRNILWDILEKASDPLPTIDLANIRMGIARAWCEGPKAVSLIRNLDGKVVDNLTLRVMQAKDLHENPRVKMAWKSRNSGIFSSEMALHMLQRLNPKLNTSKWKILAASVEGPQARRIVLMDEDSAKYIKDSKYVISSGLDKSLFKLLEDAPKVRNNFAAAKIKRRQSFSEYK